MKRKASTASSTSSKSRRPGSERMLRVCPEGHRYVKTIACPVCPVCEKKRSAGHVFGMLPAPARRALERAGVDSVKVLARFSEQEVLSWHGMGPASLPALRLMLREAGKAFRSP